MTPHRKVSMPCSQAGFLLPVAIFLLVVLSGLGAYAVRMTVLTNMSAAQDIQAVNAYLAARAGNEWAAYQINQPDLADPTMQACPDTTTLAINGFNVVVSCSSQSYVDNGSQDVQIYQVAAVASRGAVGTAEYVERRVSMLISRCIQTLSGSSHVECD